MKKPQSPHDVGGNYVPRILHLARAGTFQPGTVVQLVVEHDDWCQVFTGQPCNCTPNVFPEGMQN